jgi:hypothetical protein
MAVKAENVSLKRERVDNSVAPVAYNTLLDDKCRIGSFIPGSIRAMYRTLRCSSSTGTLGAPKKKPGITHRGAGSC